MKIRPSEAEAFQFPLGGVYFGLIAIAGVINAWAGPSFIVLTLVVIGWWLGAHNRGADEDAARASWRAGERRILVIANETVGAAGLRERIEAERGYDRRCWSTRR
jgi:hypothetical protein